jgi:HD-GYP domain-containing protein (c-di-GMP phosphodiesterase class II)
MLHTPLELRVDDALTRASLVGAFTYALDLTEGQPAGHSLRACYIASRLAQQLCVTGDAFASVYYTALLKDLGCSSNAARIHELYATDDLELKRDYKTIATGLSATLRFVVSKTGAGAPLHRRVAAIANILRNGDSIAQEMIVTRCTRGADIARELRFSDAVASGIYRLDEHWDGSGRPEGLVGADIPLPARLALLAQVADVFLQHGGPGAAALEVSRRAGSWFDPGLVQAFVALADNPAFWADLASPLLETITVAMAPDEACEVDEAFLDSVTTAFGQVIDAKSPFTGGHSQRVADLAEALGARFDMLPARLRQLRRAAALHDVGKLGVSCAILEKPGKLDAGEWDRMREHAAHTREILSRIGPLADLAGIAAAHHERLDGKGYPLGLDQRAIGRETRIITVCDFYDALTADRPYRAALPGGEALAIIEAEVGKAVDGECFAALRQMVV